MPQASISAIERTYGGDKHREFDAQELLAFTCAFDLPLLWFFLPPPGDTRRLQATSDRVNELYRLVLGREDQLEVLYARFRELGMREPDEHDLAWAAVMRTPTGVMLNDYRHRRKELLLRLLDEYADRVDASADELGEFFDHLRQVGIRGLIAEQLDRPGLRRRAGEQAPEGTAQVLIRQPTGHGGRGVHRPMLWPSSRRRASSRRWAASRSCAW